MLTFIDFDRILAKLRIRAGTQLTLCGHIVTSGLFAVMGVNKASSAKRCELCERTALCNASERSAPQAHEEKPEKIWHTANFLEHFFGTLP